LISEFHIKVRSTGVSYVYPNCKECHRAVVQAHYIANRPMYIDKAKRRNALLINETRIKIKAHFLANPCVDCGEKETLFLQFDHVRGKKLMAISEMVRRHFSWRAIQDEIAKCEVRCAHCHIRRTAISRGWWSEPT
jgi:hypothetical protein